MFREVGHSYSVWSCEQNTPGKGYIPPSLITHSVNVEELSFNEHAVHIFSVLTEYLPEYNAKMFPFILYFYPLKVKHTGE